MFHHPREKLFKEDMDDDDEFSLDFNQIYAGKKHYTVVNKNNQLLSFGDLLKSKQKQEDIAGYDVFFGDSLFGGQKLKYLSAKYGVFGAIVE